MFDAPRYVLRWALCSLTAASLAAAAWPARSAGDDTGTVVVHMRSVTAELRAYAQVEPVAELPVRAQVSGIVAGLEVHPGDRVNAGDVLARLNGPEIDAALAKHKAAVRSAQAEFEAARQTLQVRRQRKSERLGTRLQVYEAKGRLARARATLQDAKAALAAIRAAMHITSSVDATVLRVKAANGERVEPGDALAVLQGKGSLWLRAAFYGKAADAAHVGMVGVFQPTDSNKAIAVRVRDIAGSVREDGGRMVGLVPTAANPGWQSGEAGTLLLKGKPHPAVMVPSRSLILDRGQWWVLVSEDGHTRRQRVVPGPQRGELTEVASGLHEGEHVVVRDAYLRFHRNVSAQYQPPD